MRTQWLFVFALSAFAGGSAFGGEWSSGGGELLSAAQNPWFLQNAPVVSYCIKIDEQYFGATLGEARQQFLGAIDFWRREFASAAEYEMNPQYGIKLGTQELRETPCAENPDLILQFGVLDAGQKAYLEDPARLTAIAVRTDYDFQELRGRGFIYVSPESGPLAMRSPFLVDHPWSDADGARLRLVLVHELGHVYGMPHHDKSDSPMWQELPGYIVTKSANSYFWRHPSHVFVGAGETRTYEGCEGDMPFPTGRSRAILGLSSDMKCVRVVVSDRLTVYGAKDAKSTWKQVGEGPCMQGQGQMDDYAEIVVDERQRVIPHAFQVAARFPIYATTMASERSFTFRPSGHTGAPAWLTVKTDRGAVFISGFDVDGPAPNVLIFTN